MYCILFMKSTNTDDNSGHLYEEENSSSCNTSAVKFLNFKYYVCFECFFFWYLRFSRILLRSQHY